MDNFNYDKSLFINSYFSKHGTNPRKMSKEQLQSIIEMECHRIEKGLSLKCPKFNFGIESGVLSGIQKLSNEWRLRSKDDAQEYNPEILAIIYDCLQSYYEFHKDKDLSKMRFVKEYLSTNECEKSNNKNGATNTVFSSKFLSKSIVSESFFKTRRSIRDFKDIDIPNETIKRLVGLAINSTPTVCNRSLFNVSVVKNKELKREILSMQNGNAGFGHNASAIIIPSVKLECFKLERERLQPHIAGGMFSMSLIYTLHANKIATCCLNWSVDMQVDINLKKTLGLDKETVPMLIAIGGYPEKLRIARSSKPTADEVLKILE